jgi:hypothetical protein
VDDTGCATKCPKGYACLIGSSDAFKPKVPCARGYWCGEETADPKANPCPGGSYSYREYLTEAAECTPCPPGKACAAASLRPVPCQAGYYCPPKTTDTPDKNPCPAGTYSIRDDLADVSECTPCPKGHYCKAKAVVPIKCPTKKYRNTLRGTAEGDCATCPAGYYCLTAQVEPVPCGKGYYSSSNANTCTKCSAGKYCPDEATTKSDHDTKYICPAGLYCPAGFSTVPTNLYNRCKAGHYCTAGVTTEEPCPAGKIRTLPGGAELNDCTDVPPGFYGAGQG